jgi:uncharacterized phage protein (TIGR01671 family)
MKIPKFRAWTEEGKVMYYDVYPFKDDTLLLSYDEIGFDEVPASDFILMQSTGLIDKNGKEIFEGDIVKVLNSLYTVFYDSEKGSFRLKPHDKRWHTDYMSNFSYGGNFEVIGNMYEGVNDDNS